MVLSKRTRTKVAISFIALAALATKLLWPNLKIDAVTLGILAIGLLPWFSDLIKSAEFPGGFKVEFHDLDAAGEKVLAGGAETMESAHTTPIARVDDHDDFQAINDPNLALVALRIDIERSLRRIADKGRLPIPGRFMSASGLLREVNRVGYVDQEMYDGLSYIIQAANDAAHGADVDSTVLPWVKQNAGPILAKLNAID